VALTQIGAALTTWMALGLARVSLDTAVERGVESFGCSWAELVVVGPLSFSMAGYGVQSMGRLRSDFEELYEALEDMSGGDEFSLLQPLLFKWISCTVVRCCQ
jgi:hypothetical protein